MNSTRRTSKIKHLYLALALAGLLLLIGWPRLVTAMPLTAKHHLERAWLTAADVGRFEYNTAVRQTTHPTARLENAGRHPTTQQMTAEGWVDRPNKAMQMRLWSPGAGRDGIELRVEGGKAFGRLDTTADWQEIPNPTDIFAPGGDPLGFLVAAENVQELGVRSQGLGVRSQTPALQSLISNPNPQLLIPNPYKRYAFEINGPRYAAYVRNQLEAAMREKGQLPPGLHLGIVRQYVDMTGRGEIWINEDGLPTHQIIHLEFPPEPGAFDWTEAEITTEFGGWGAGIRNQGLLPLARRLWQNPTQLFANLQSLPPNPQSLTPALGLALLLAALALAAITHRKSPKFYAAATLAMIVAMLVTPLLQSNQVHAFVTRQNVQHTEFEQQRQTYQAAQNAQPRMRAGYNPAVNPLAETLPPPNLGGTTASPPLGEIEEGQTYAVPHSPFTNHQSPITILGCALTNLTADCDGDTLSNGTEINKLGTDPTRADTDGDFISDKTEVQGFSQNGHTWYLDPLNPDSNGDFVMDGSECPQRMDIDAGTGLITPDITPGLCTNTDSDSAPDVFDYDDDDDGVPDNVDLARLAKSAEFDSVGNNLEFNLSLNGNGEPIFVDFQIRPPDVSHLYQTNNVLDWPTNDTSGQVRRVTGRSFAQTPGYESTYRGNQGDMILNPLLEIEIAFDAANPSAGLPITPTMTSADITGYSDLSWLDTDALTQLGISVNEGENNTLLLWAPLTFVEDELAGDSRVAWQARMMYRPETSQSTLGTDQTVRLVWMIEALTDNCSPPAGEDYGEYCADTANWTTTSSVIQTYYESFTLTGLTVREDHGIDVAVIADPPGGSYDDDLWHMADSLQEALVKGEQKSAGSRFSTLDIPTYASTWGVNGLDITTFSYDTQLGLAEIAGGESTDILSAVFSGAGVGDSATLLIAGEETARLVSLGDTAIQWSGNTLKPDLTSDLAWLNTTTTLRWSPYIYKGAGVWDSLNLETYFSDHLAGDLTTVFTNSELDKLVPGETISDYDKARAGAILLAQNYYMALHIGLGGLVVVDGQLTNSDLLADYSKGSDEPVTRIVTETLADIKNFYGQISLVQQLTGATDSTTAAATALSATFATSSSAILEAAGDVAQGNAGNVLSLTFQKLEDYYKTTPVDAKFSNVANFIALASASLVSGLSETLGISYSYAKIAWALFSIKFGLDVINGSVAAAQAAASAGLAAGTNVVTNSAKYVWNSVTIWAVAVFVLTVTLIWTMYALGDYSNPLQRSAALARTIAATIVAVIMLIITLIPVVGFLISAVIGLIDGLAALICASVGVKAGSTVDVWACGGITGILTTAITYLIFDQYMLVDMDDNNRMDLALETPELIQKTDNPGPLVGNEVLVNASITTTISLDKPTGKFDRKTIDKLLASPSLEQRLKQANFAYYLQEQPLNHHSNLTPGELEWTDNTERFDVTLQKAFTEPGINQPSPVQYLTESFNIPYVECWTSFCNGGRYKDSFHIYLGEDVVFDVFPTTFSEFVNLTAVGNSSYRLSWDNKFPTLIDGDGDGLRSKAGGGPDPDDNAWDADSDGLSDFWERNNGFDPATPNADGDDLSDYWEAFYGTNPRLADSDGDGLTDGDEFFHSRSRHPYEQDNQAWIGGWGITYYNTANQTLTAHVSAGPLDYDSDDDTISDEHEQIYGYNPNLPSVLNVLTLNSDISANAVQPGATVNYTATIKNELDGRTLNGLLQAELPVDVIRSTEVMDTLTPLQSITMTGNVAAPVVAQSTATSLTLRAGVVVSSTIVEADPPGPVFYLSAYNPPPTPPFGYTNNDDSGYNQTVTCGGEIGFSCPDNDTASQINAGFDFDEFKRLKVNGQNSLRLGSNDNTFSMMMWINPQKGYSPNDLHFEEFGRTVLGSSLYDNPETAFPSLALQKISSNVARMVVHFGHADGLGYCRASGATIDFNRWQHIVVTFDGGQFKFYVDGVLESTSSGQNCAGQNLYSKKNFTIGQSDGLALHFKYMEPKKAVFDEGYVWSNNNKYYINEDFFFPSFHRKHINPNNDPEMIWYPGEDVIHENPSSGPLVYYNLDNWAISGDNSLTWWACNQDDISEGYPLGCLDSDANIDEPLYYKKNGSKKFERTHTQFDAKGEYIVDYDKGYKDNKWGGEFRYNLYNNAFKGKLDEIALYNTYLSTTDVENLYLSSLRAAYLTFDEPPGQTSFEDATAFNIVATCTAPHCPDSGIPGRDNQTLRFDGTDDYVDFPMPLDPAAEAFTAAAWFKLNDISGNNRILQQLDGSGTGRSWLSIANGDLRSNLGGAALSLPTGITANRWYHAAVTSDGSEVRLYLDGVLVDQETITAEASDGGLRIGADKAGGNPFGGLIDEVVVQRGPAVTATIQSLMREAPVLNLHLDENLAIASPTTSFVDDTPYSNNATCSGNACPAAGTKGQVREAIILDGTNDQLTANLTSLNLDKGRMTLAMWVRPEQPRSSEQTLLNMGELRFYMPSDSSQLALDIRMDGPTTASCSYTLSLDSGEAGLNLNRWNHVAFTIAQIQGRTYPVTLYLNGVQVAQKYTSYPSSDPCENITDTPIFGDNFAGNLDEIALFDSTLRSSEIKDLYDYQVAWYDQTYEHRIVVDVDNPQVSLGLETSHLPLADTLLDIEAVDISSDIVAVQVAVNGPGGTTNPPAVRSDDPTSEAWFFTFAPAAAGQYTIDLLATDEAGNTGSSATTTVYVDGTPPAAMLDGSLTAGPMQTTGSDPSTVNLFGIISDSGSAPPAGVDGDSIAVELLDWQGAAVQGSHFADDTPGGWFVAYPFAQPAYGRYDVRLSAADTAGNVYSATLGSIALDDLAPTGDIILSGDLLTDTTVTLTGTAATIPHPGQSKRLALHFEEAAGAPQFADATPAHAAANCAAGCPAAGQSGQYGSAAQFGGSESLTVTTAINPISDTFTALLWFNPTSLGGTLLAQQGGDSWLALTGSGQLNSALGGSSLNSGSTVSSGQWRHAAVTFDGEFVRLYLDGTLEISATRTLAFNNGDFVIGQGFNGRLDEVVVYDSVLNAGQIYHIANPLDTGVASAQIRFRHQMDADQGEAEGTWHNATLASSGQNFTTWNIVPPTDLEGPYKIDLRVTNDLGHTNFIPNVWNGDIDLAAPRLTLDYTQLSSQYARAECYAYDYNITDTNWLCPADNPIAIPESSDWYVQAFTTTRTTAYSTTLQTVSALSDTLTACDSFGHCATTTITSPVTLIQSVAIITPAETTVLTGLIPIEVAGYARSDSTRVKNVTLLANGQPVYSEDTIGAPQEFNWSTTWQPTAAGVYTLEAVMTTVTHNQLTDPVDVTVTFNAPTLEIAKTQTPAQPDVGDPLTYTITVTNSGNLPAAGVRITDTLPAEVTGANLDQTVTLPVGASISYTIPASISSNFTTIQNTAWVSHTWQRNSASAYVFRCDRFEVLNDDDSGPGSLRFAIDNTCGASLITFAADFTITLESQLTVDGDTITIDAEDHTIVISNDYTTPANQVKLFEVTSGSALTMTNLNLDHGLPAIESFGALSVFSSTFQYNKRAIVHNSSNPLLVSHSVFDTNFALAGLANDGAALHLSGGGPATVSHSLFRNNSAARFGAAIYNNGSTLAMLNSTFTGNRTTLSNQGGGAAIYNNSGAADIRHSTFSGNHTGLTSSAYPAFTADVHHAASESMLIANSILANSSRGANCRTTGSGSLTVVNTLIEDNTCGATFSGDPTLSNFADYGPSAGSGQASQTFALQPNSPAINAGDPTYCPADDQRGQPRPFGTTCDLGAFEAQGYTVVTSGSDQITSLNATFSQPLSLTVYHGGTDVTVKNGVPITLTSPSAGAGLSPVQSNGFLNSQGHYEKIVTTNGIGGAYPVTATIAGISPFAAFTLTNEAVDLAITKTLVTAVPLPGQSLTYTIAFSNQGSITATGIVITDTLPPEFAVQNSQFTLDNGGTITQTGAGPLRWSVSDLLPGAGGVITLTGLLTDSVSLAQPIVNQVEISGAETEGNTENNAATVSSPASCYPAARLYVDADATGADTGLTWTDAFPTLQDALAAAGSCGLAEEIWVAEGVYYPDEGGGQSNSNRNATFILQSGLALYGGFNGTETLLNQRNITASLTILSGDIDQNDTPIGGVVTDTANLLGNNSYHVLAASGTDSSAVLDGFTITAGRAIGNSTQRKQGAGLFAISGDPTLRNLVFSGNFAADDAGGIYAPFGDLTLQNVTLTNNKASNDGGGIYSQSGSLALQNVSFDGNEANRGGAVYAAFSDAGLLDVTLVDNQAGNAGGGLYLAAAETTMERASFRGNKANTGGGLYLSGHTLVMTNSLFSGNKANSAGGAIANIQSDVSLLNVSFGGNNAGNTTGVIHNSNPVANTLTNVAMSHNGNDTAAVPFNEAASFTISHSVIQGGCPIGAACTNVTGSDALFVDTPDPAMAPATDSDLRLLPGSAAINAGTNTGAPGEDIQGLARPIDGVVDAGAFESQGFTLTGSGGSNQITVIGNAFADPLAVTITSSAGEPVGPGGQVAFSRPVGGAGLLDNPAIGQTDAAGLVELVAVANNITGSYVVTAAANGVAGQSAFVLTNTQAALVLTKQVAPASAAPSEVVTYTLSFANNGVTTIPGIVITDNIPAEISIQQVISSGDVSITRTLSNQTSEVFETSEVSPGAGGIITLTAQLTSPLAAGPLRNTAVLTSDVVGGGSTGLVAAEVTVLNIAPVITGSGPLTISEKEANGTLIGAVTASDVNGDGVSFAITAGNPGNAFAIDVAGGDIRINNNGPLDYEAATQHLLTVAAGDGALTSTTIVTVNLTNVDTDLSLTKAAVSNLPAGAGAATDYLTVPGDIITYTLTFANVGNDDAAGIIITDALPSEFTLLTTTASVAVTQTGTNPLQWSVGNVAPGQSGIITLTGQVDGGLADGAVFTNSAAITGTIPEANSANNQAAAAVTGCANTIQVQNGNATGSGSLHEAVSIACEGATITFATDMTVTVIYTNGDGTNFDINKGLTIDGEGQEIVIQADLSTFEGNFFFEPLFNINASTGPVTLRDLTVIRTPRGAMVGNGADITLENVTVTGNTNPAEGGIVGASGGQLRLVNSRIVSNTAPFGRAVGLDFGAVAFITNTLIANNIITDGVGLRADDAVVTITHSTLVGNGSPNSFGEGNIYVRSFGSSSQAFLHHSIVGGGVLDGIIGQLDCQTDDGNIVDLGYNLLGPTCGLSTTTSSHLDSSRVFSDVITSLDAAGDVYLRPGSPALDGGVSGPCLVSTDQRGVARPQGDACDIGAVESLGFTLTITGSNQTTLVNTPFAVPLQVALNSGDSGAPLDGYVITFTAPPAGAGVTTATFTATTDVGGAVSVPVNANGVAGSYVVTAAIAGLEPAAFNLANTLAEADLLLTKAVTPLTVAPSQAITYTLTFENIGSSVAAGVILTDILPSQFAIQNSQFALDSGVTITPTPGITYEWTVSNLAYGQGGVITLTGAVADPLAAGVFSNTATITTLTLEGNPANNVAEAGVTIPNFAPELEPLETLVATGTDTLTTTFAATDANGDSLVFSLAGAAAGMSVTPGGLFSWPPPEVGYDEVYSVTVIVSDGVLTASDVLYIAVIDVNEAPQLGSVVDQTVVEGATVNFTVPFSDTDVPAQPLTLSLSNAPAGASLDGGGNFSWPTAEADGPGVYSVTLNVSDGLLTTSQTIAITVTEQNEPPLLAAVPDQTVPEGATISFTAVVSDSDVPAQSLTFSLSNAPAGASLDGGGNFTWPTTESDDGVYTPTLSVSDGVVTTSQTITLTVTEVNQPPVLAALSNQTLNEGDLLAFTATATDTDLPAQSLTFSLMDAPFGAVISNTGGFSWQTNDTHGGSVYTITVVVSDGVLTDSQTIALTVEEVNQPPAFAATLTGRTVAEGDTLSVNAIASDPDVPAQPLTYSLANAPTGMTINGIGRITWPTTEADGPSLHSVTVRVSDGVVTTSQTLAITVTEINSPVTIGPLSDVTVAEGETISFTVAATDTDVPAQTLTYALQTDTGAAINSSGLFSWPTTEADGGDVYAATILVSDGVATTSQTIAMTVTEVNNAPVMAPLVDRTVGERSLVGFTVVATDTDVPAQPLTFSLSNAPAEATIGPSSGNFAWLTTEDDGPGVYSATIHVSDGVLTTSQTIAITVTELNDPPVITPVATQTVTETFEISFTVIATDDPAQNLFYSLGAGAPLLATINNDGDFYWTPGEDDGPQTHTMTVQVSDGLLTSTQEITITVLEDNTPPSLAPIAGQTVLEGNLLTVTLVATDTDVPAQPLTYTVSGLPAPAAVDGSGLLSWQTDETNGGNIYTATVMVSDGVLTAGQSFTVSVIEVDNPPQLTGPTVLTATEGVTFSHTFTAADENPSGLTFGLINPPGGSSFDGSSGLFEWPPTEAQGPGAYLFGLTVTDTTGLTDTTVVIINVQEVNIAPSLAAIGDWTIIKSKPFTLTLSATDSDLPAQTLSYIMTNAPAGAGLTHNLFSWTPDAAQGPGQYSLTFIVSDDGTPVLTDSETITLTVTNGPGVVIAESGGLTEVSEGDITDTYQIALDSPPAEVVTVTITSDSQLDASVSRLTFLTNTWNVSQTVVVTAVDDSLYEGPHSGTISHTVSSGDGDFDGISATGITATISDNEALPVISVSDVDVDESVGTAAISVTLTGQSVYSASVDYAISDGSANGNGVDYAISDGSANGTLTWAANTTGTQVISLTIVDDTLDEPDETVNIDLTGVISATLLKAASGVLTITDNDAAPNLSITKAVTFINTPAKPGDAITYTIVISNSGGGAENVVVSDTLPAGINGVDLSQTVTITAGEQVTFTLSVMVGNGVPVGLTTITNTAGFSHSSGTGQASASLVVSKTSEMLYLSTSRNGTVAGLLFADEDILAYDAGTDSWAKLFDGSDVGFRGADLDAFTLLDDGSLLLSPDRSRNLAGVGQVDDSDIVRFVPTSLGQSTAGSFEWYFDGSDVGLTRNSEDVDAVSVMSDGSLLLSTIGRFTVPGVGGRDEDLIRFIPTSLGENTSGTWTRYFDGSDVGLRLNNEDVRGGQVDEAGGDIYLTTKGHYAVAGLSGAGTDIFICTPGSLGADTACTFSSYWLGANYGLTQNVDAFAIGGQVEVGINSAANSDITTAEVEVDNIPEEEDIPADDADEENDPDETHNQDDTSTGVDNGTGTIFLPLIMKNGSASADAPGTASLPDVVVEDVSLTLVTGNTYTVTLGARNQGGAVSYGNNFFLNAYLNSNLSSPIIVCSVQATDMGAGQSVICKQQYTFNNGTDTLRGWVDPYNHVVEGNENNNTLEAGVVALDNQGVSTTDSTVWPAGPLPTPTPNAPQR